MKEKFKIQPGSAQETLIVPLYARKKCTERFPDFYQDPLSVELCQRIDYDFSALDKMYNNFMYEFGALEGAVRQMDMMYEINDYIKDHPKASIVCLGCGLDQDPRRCGGSDNKIYNIDFPDVIEIREELAGVDPREVNISGDLTKHEWMDKIDASNGAIFYAAGVLYYLQREDVRKIVLELAERFKGCVFVFDTVNKFAFKMMMKVVLKNHGMSDVQAYFYSAEPIEEIHSWDSSLKVSTRGYMLGYYDLKSPSIKGLHRLLAKVADKRMKMNIVKVDF